MKIPLKPLRTTILGGAVFLIPLVVILMVTTKSLGLINQLSTPLAAIIPRDSIGGIAVANILAILMLLLICFAAGLLARRAVGRSLSEGMESKLHAIYPRYTVIKGMTQFLRSDHEMPFNAVLARFDDNAQIAFEIERSESGLVTLFLPGAPDPWSGAVIHMNADRVTPLETDFKEVTKTLKGIGKGTAAILDTNDIKQLEEAD